MQTPSIDQLRRAVKIADRIQKLEKQVTGILGTSAAPVRGQTGVRRKRRKMSAAGRVAIAKAQRARWAKIKAGRK